MEVIGVGAVFVEAIAEGFDAVEGHAGDGEDPHEEDAPAEVGDFAAAEGVEEGEEEEGCCDDAAHVVVDVAELGDGVADHLGDEAVEVETPGGLLEIAHEGEFVRGAAEA